MNDRFDDELNVSDEELDALDGLLSHSTIWGDTDSGLEDSIVAAIAAERDALGTPQTTPAPAAETELADEHSNVIPIDRKRTRIAAFAAGAVAAAALIIGAIAIGQFVDTDKPDVELALEATDIAPEAVATASISETPLGTRIILDVSDLPPAAPGTYYEAWMRVDAATGVSAGTFHLRGGDGEIELWAGVTADEYPLFTVTLQDEAQTESSGVVVLKGLIEPDD